MTNLTILNIEIKQDSAGRFSLNDLHRASGGEEKNRPSFWLVNQKTQALISELMSDGGNPTSVVKGGNNQGTYVCKELVYSYAMWVSAKFNLEVIRTFDRVNQGATNFSPVNLNKSEVLLVSLDSNNQLTVKPVTDKVLNPNNITMCWSLLRIFRLV